MRMDHALRGAVAALGLSLLATGVARADETWQGYAPRCQPMELARDVDLQDPCEMPVATFGITGPTVLSRNESLDVQSTGSIDRDSRGTRSEDRPRL